MTFILAINFALTLSGCGGEPESYTPTQTVEFAETAATEITTAHITAAVTTVAETTNATEAKPPKPPEELSEYFDKNGLITEKGIEQIKRIARVAEENKEFSYIQGFLILTVKIGKRVSDFYPIPSDFYYRIPQISSAYWRIVRSLENFPALAVFKRHFLRNSSRFL